MNQAKAVVLPTSDPAVFKPGDVITINGMEYVVQQVQRGERRIMVTNPRFTPDGGEPRFVYLTFDEAQAANSTEGSNDAD